MKKIRILSILIVFVLLAELLPPVAFEVKAAGGYYEITDVLDLYRMSKDLSGTYVLKNDIDLKGLPWTPIGSDDTPFTGQLFGNGHVISDFYVEITAEGGNALAGFFGNVSHATITELAIIDADIRAFTYNNDSDTRCFASAGGIAGSINDYTTISRCCFYGILRASGGKVNYARTGGIASGVHSGSIISDCFACADMICRTETANAMAGGICAWLSDANIERCYFEGDIAVPDDCYTYAAGINASGNKDGRVEGCVSAANSLSLQAAVSDHCVYNPVGCFGGEYADNAYREGITVSADIVGESSSQRISEEDLYDSSFYEGLGWYFGPGGWVDTYRCPRLAGVGRRIILGEDTLNVENLNIGTIDYYEYFDVINGETGMNEGQLRANMYGDGLCFGLCALTECLLNEKIDVREITQSGYISDIDFSNDSVNELGVKQFTRYLHVMQYDDDYRGDGYCTTMQGVFDTVKAYVDGVSDEVPILKVKSESWWTDWVHAIIGIDYNEYDDRTEILCYDPNYPKGENVLTLYKDSNGEFVSWDFYFFPIIVKLSSEKPGNLLKFYENSSRIYDDLMEEQSVFMTREEMNNANS
ncbi:MAG: hypothetical protein IKG70_07140 [Lachnospiraceae bacterium]|nr:hypothetical protein [Lachnospiraceae bacterium]